MSYAKNGETALEMAQRKGHCDVVSYLLEKLTGKISIKGDGGTSGSVSREGESIFSPLKGEVSQACERSLLKLRLNQLIRLI